jgi:DNA-binding MarR family transcriptional regulator
MTNFVLANNYLLNYISRHVVMFTKRNTMQEILTERELEVFEAIKFLAKTRKDASTQAEIAEFIGCGQRTVGRAMDGLERKGYIDSEVARENRRPRSYRITKFQRTRKNARTA